MLRKLIDWNISVCDAIERLLPKSFGPNPSLKRKHTLAVAELMNARPSQTILDIGGGYICPFAEYRKEELDTKFIMVDISEDQLKKNQSADYRIVLDACKPLPIGTATVDLVVTRTLLEHLQENKTLVKETGRVLVKGGHVAHIFPCKFAPFAILNLMLPDKLSKKLLNLFFPKWSGEVGFKSYYKNCHYPRFMDLLKDSGFIIEEQKFNYYQSIYYKFFVPIYICSLLYDLLLWRTGFRPLCCEIFVVARYAGSEN